MTDTITTPIEPPGRFQFGWISEVLFHPRRAFTRITPQHDNVWLTPMLILTVTTLLRVITVGWLQQQATALNGAPPMPPGWEYYTPEQQAQYMQTMQATQGPVFLYVLPALANLAIIWIGWLLVGGALHLVLTLLGGRGSTGAAMNVVAWAGLAWAARDGVRILYMLITHKLITAPGLSGFTPADSGALGLFLAKLLALVDIYLLWHILLVIIGVRARDNLPRTKAAGGVIFTIVAVVLVQALLGYLTAGLGNLSITRPFFF